MRIGLRSNLQYTTAISRVGGPYAISGFRPALVFDFDDEYYRTSRAKTTFESAISHNSTTAQNGTMVDSDGLLKWRPHNLLLRSEEFNETTWGKTNVNVTPNQAIAPDGTNTADLVEAAASGDWRVVQTFSSVNSNHTFGIWLRSISGTGAIGIRIFNGSSFEDTLCNLSETWAFFEVLHSGSTQNCYIDSRVSGSNLTQVYLWGAHLYRSDLGGMVNNPDRGDSYVPSTTSARYLPRRGHHVYNGTSWVNEGLLVESEARTNLITYSEDFTDASWTGGGFTVTANDTTAPDGTLTADKIVWTATTEYHSIFTAPAASGSTTYTRSVFVKSAGLTWIYLQQYDPPSSPTNRGVWFDIENGTKGTEDTGCTGAIQDVGNGWYRCSVAFTTSAGATAERLQVGFTTGDGVSPLNILGDGTSGVYLWGAQLEAGSTPSSYIPTNGATATRGAETLTVAAADLPWPTPRVIGPELVTNGTFDSDLTGWGSGGVDGASASVIGAAARLVGNSYTSQTISGLTAGQTYLLTADITGTNSQGSLRIGTSINVGDIYDSPTQNSATTLTRIFVPSGSAVIVTLKAESTPGNTSDYMDFDNISVREIDPLSVSIQMDGRMTYADTGELVSSDGASGTVLPFRWRKDSTNYISYVLTTEGVEVGNVWFMQEVGGVFDYKKTSGDPYSPGILVPYDISSRHGSTFINGAVSGTALTADTTPTALPDLSSTNLQLAYDYNGTIKTFRMWAKDLTDAGLEEATS